MTRSGAIRRGGDGGSFAQELPGQGSLDELDERFRLAPLAVPGYEPRGLRDGTRAARDDASAEP